MGRTPPDWMKDKAAYHIPLIFVMERVSQPNTCTEEASSCPLVTISLALWVFLGEGNQTILLGALGEGGKAGRTVRSDVLLWAIYPTSQLLKEHCGFDPCGFHLDAAGKDSKWWLAEARIGNYRWHEYRGRNPRRLTHNYTLFIWDGSIHF